MEFPISHGSIRAEQFSELLGNPRVRPFAERMLTTSYVECVPGHEEAMREIMARSFDLLTAARGDDRQFRTAAATVVGDLFHKSDPDFWFNRVYRHYKRAIKPERRFAILRGLLCGERVLDLGCGPGLYARELARRGHRVTGMDFSERSVAYARESARAAGLDIEYAVADYVADELGSGYDLAMMIYCDLGALSPADRASVLRKVLRSLSPGGAFVFDFADDSVPGTSGEGRSWLLEESGFWSPRPHLVLEETKTYPELKMVQRMALVAEEDGSRIERYMIRDWCFSRDEMRDLVLGAGFSSCAFHRGFLPKPVWGTADPIFAVASAPRASEVRRVHHPCHDSVDDEPQDRDGADADRGNEDIEAHDRRDDHE